MKWYMFVIYYQCIWTGVSDIYAGIACMMGLIYMGYAESVYAVMPALRVLNVILGIVFILLGALSFYARYHLKRFSSEAFSLYLASLALPQVFSLILYVILRITLASNVLSRLALTSSMGSMLTSVMNWSVVIGLVQTVVICVLNYVYYDRRRRLFEN